MVIQFFQHLLLKRLSWEMHGLKIFPRVCNQGNSQCSGVPSGKAGTSWAPPAALDPVGGSEPSCRVVMGSPHCSPAATAIRASVWPGHSFPLQMPKLKLEVPGRWHRPPCPVVGALWGWGLLGGLFADLQTHQLGPGGGARDDRSHTEGSLLWA